MAAFADTTTASWWMVATTTTVSMGKRGEYRSPLPVSNESVQEFRVQSSGYGSESGRAGGAVVNVVTKSGTNTGTAAPFIICATVP